MPATREACWPVWIWDESDWDHSAPYFGYVRYAEKDALEAIFGALNDAGFAFDYQIGLYMQEETDPRVPRTVARLVERALEGYLRGPVDAETARARTDVAPILARHGLRLAGWRVEA